MQRCAMIYGYQPYNKLGILHNAENLVLDPTSPTSPNNPLGDHIDFSGAIGRNNTGNISNGSRPSTAVGVTHIDRLFSLVRDNSNSMMNLIIVITVLVTENLVKGNLFTCPCEKPQNKLYGIAFLVAPATALFVVSVMANNTTWLLVTGCWHRQDTDYPQDHHSHFYHAIGVVTKAMVAPLAWIIISFIDGQFYRCAASVDPCGESDKVFLMSKSQMIGYVILIVSMFTAICGMLLWRAFRPISYVQHSYINIYRTMERVEMHRQFEDHARCVATQNVGEFLAKESRSKKDWDYIANVPSLSPVGGPSGRNAAPPSMSPLNKLVLRERSESGGFKVAVLPPGGATTAGIENLAVQAESGSEEEYVPLSDLKVEFKLDN